MDENDGSVSRVLHALGGLFDRGRWQVMSGLRVRMVMDASSGPGLGDAVLAVLDAEPAGQVEPRPVTTATSDIRTAGRSTRVYEGVRVFDTAAGVLYEVAVDNDGQVVALTLVPLPGRRLAATTPLPVARLGQVATEALWDSRWRSVRPAGPGPDGRPNRMPAPSSEEVARVVLWALERDKSPRHLLAARYGYRLVTADKWIARARQAGLLGEDDKERKRRTIRPTETGEHE